MVAYLLVGKLEGLYRGAKSNQPENDRLSALMVSNVPYGLLGLVGAHSCGSDEDSGSVVPTIGSEIRPRVSR